MDPLIAAQIHNIENSRLGGLPEEILLHILGHVDEVSLYCLRRISRKFRRLIFEPKIWHRMEQSRGLYNYELRSGLSVRQTKELAGHLRKDGLCDECKSWCDVRADGSLKRRADPMTCRFRSQGRRSLRCPPCDAYHDSRAFPSADQSRRDWQCLGRLGAVQLCEHVHVSWSNIEGHVKKWRERTSEGRGWGEEKWQSCLGDFSIECRDSSHDARCTDEEVRTWPRARLVTTELYPDAVFLTLEWKPHSGLDIFTRTPDGQALPSELRELFKGYREGAGGVIIPSYTPNLLPEMACYDPDDCCCLLYDPGSSKTWGPTRRTEFASFFRKNRPFGCFSLHRHTRRIHWRYIQQVQMKKHWPRGIGDSVCLVTNYERRVQVFDKAERGGKLNPGHTWLHTMDPDTYPRPALRFDVPLCENRDCMNYYQRPKTFDCS